MVPNEIKGQNRWPIGPMVPPLNKTEEKQPTLLPFSVT